MDPKQPSFDRPNTLGQAWQKMSQPRGRKVADLPPLPDWPPLPGERFRGDWPPPDTEPETPIEPMTLHTDQQAGGAKASQPRRLFGISWRESDILGRWRRASKRMRVAIAAALVLSMALIAACSSFALHVAGDLGSSAATSLNGASATQQAPGQGSAPGGSATTTPSPAGAATSVATSVATSAPNTPLTLTFTCASGSVRGTGKICVHTIPSASLSLSVRYCDGSTAKGLHSAAVADASGNYTWSWPVHMTCAGPALATVIAKSNGASLTATTSFTITA